MHIIFGSTIEEIPNSFTVLELDTFRMVKENRTDTAYCVVEKIPLTEFTTLDAYKKIHADLVRYYKQRQWEYCENAIEGLMGKWNGELDTFYTDLLQRVIAFKQTPPAEDWDGLRVKI
jgi:adenylate cyclase